MKKILAMLLVLAMVLSLAACTKEENKPADENKTTDAPVVDTKTDENVELTMWCIATESDSNRHSYEAAIADMAKKYPNIKLNWEATENQAYKTKIKAAVQADTMPDIFFTWSCAFLGDFVDAGRVYCLDTVYQDFKNELPEVMLGNTTYNGKHYGVPLTMNIVGLFANMDLLKQVGYTEVPGTYDEFIKCCDALKAANIIPFGCAGKETWCVTEYLEPVIEKSVGADALNDIFLGRATWNNADVAAAVDTFQGLVNNGYFDPDGIALSNDEVKANFMAGKYAFYINGTWNCADFDKAGLSSKIQVSEFPVVDSSKSKLGELIGGPSDTLAVAKSSKHVKEAAECAFELAKGICKYGYLVGAGLPAWTPDYDTSNINPLTTAVSEICANASQYVLFGDTAMSAETAGIYLDYVAKIYSSEISGEDFVNGLVKDIK